MRLLFRSKPKLQDNYTRSGVRFGTTFIHIPKTAGTSISKILGFYGANHSSISMLSERHKIPDDHEFFTIVRDPLSRFISAYYHIYNRRMDSVDNYNFIQCYPTIDQINSYEIVETLSQSKLPFLPQHSFLEGTSSAKVRKFEISDERLLDYIFKVYSIKIDKLPVERVGSYSAGINGKLTKIILDTYHEDLDLYESVKNV